MLADAPAVVASLDAYAQATLKSAPAITLLAQGFLAPAIYQADLRFSNAAAASIPQAVLRAFGHTAYPSGFSLSLNSEALYREGEKLGLGSSAATCVACYLAFCEFLERKPSFQEVLDIHRSFQGGSGSGLDIAAAWYGGVITFAQGRAEAFAWPQELSVRIYWTGKAASTVEHLQSFSAWRKSNADTTALGDLCSAAEALTSKPDKDQLTHYVECLGRLDQAASLNIFTSSHQRLASAADSLDLVYKPCGAGGGDVGMAFSWNADASEQFAALDEQVAPFAQPLEHQFAPTHKSHG